MTNHQRLTQLLADVFLLEPEQVHLELKRDDIDTWDSLGVVSLAVGLHQTFEYHLTPDEAMSISSVRDIINILSVHGIDFNS